jgi:hypothetical protein
VLKHLKGQDHIVARRGFIKKTVEILVVEGAAQLLRCGPLPGALDAGQRVIHTLDLGPEVSEGQTQTTITAAQIQHVGLGRDGDRKGS